MSNRRRSSLFVQLAFVFVVCTFARHAAAQDFRIVSSNVSDGAAGIAIVDTFYFEFSEILPFNSLFSRGFHWEPDDRAHRTNAFLDADRIRPRFTITHEAETDYAVYAFGVRSDDGEYMSEPFTLNYTTADAHGTLAISGELEIEERTAAKTDQTARLRNLIAEEFGQTQTEARSTERKSTVAYQIAGSSGAGANQQTLAAGGNQQTQVPGGYQQSPASSAKQFEHTIVFLLDEFSLRQDRWAVRAAETVDAEGRFEFEHVRSGSYYPIAVQFAGPEGDAIGAYGFYDPDGDYAPNAVSVGEENRSGITLSVYPFEFATAFANMALTEPLLLQRADSMAFVAVSSLDLTSEGWGAEWNYEYYAESVDSVYSVRLNPITITISATEASPFEGLLTPIPVEEVIDSDEALSTAEQSGGSGFRSGVEAADLTISIRGGSLLDEWPTDPLRLLWRVRYEKGTSLDPDYEALLVYMDMSTGEVLDVVSTSSEDEAELPSTIILRQNYPNPFNPATTIAFDLARSGYASLRVYDVLGRRVETLIERALPAGRHEVVWKADGIPSGIYYYRVETGGTSQTRSMILMR